MKLKRLLTRSLSFALSLVMILSLNVVTAFADDGYDPNAGQGSGNQAESVSGGGWSSVSNQGYRVSLLSGNSPFPLKTGKPTVVDILYSSKPSGAQAMMENRLGQSASGEVVQISTLAGANAIPYSILWGGSGFEANGDAVRAYLLGGSGGTNGGGQGNPGGGTSSGPTINWSGTSGGGGGGSAEANTGGSTGGKKFLL